MQTVAVSRCQVARRTTCSNLRPRARCAASTKAVEAVDFKEMGKYVAAPLAQASILIGITYGLDQVMHMSFFPEANNIPRATVWLWFAFLSVKSRTFALMQTRDKFGQTKNEDGKLAKRKQPSWFPPKLIFPVMWSLMALLRATAATIIWDVSGQTLVAAPIALFLLHLSIGDTWNYITNSKGEMGVSVAYVSVVWISAALLDYSYFTQSTTAGYVLLPLCVWLTAAAVLVFSLWDANGRASLLPVVENE